MTYVLYRTRVSSDDLLQFRDVYLIKGSLKPVADGKSISFDEDWGHLFN